MRPAVIPIHVDASCGGKPAWRLVEPSLVGDPQQVMQVLAAVKRQVDAELGAEVPEGVWLRGLRLHDGEAEMQLAPELACKSFAIATIAFDTMRTLLPDTDIYVGAAPT